MEAGKDMITIPVIEVTKTAATLPLLLRTVVIEIVAHRISNMMTANQLGEEMIEVCHRDHRRPLISLMMVEDQIHMVIDPDLKI